ncbi:MAG TPA: alcohol dehydrogenase catalytic domain-containing protein, partial [Acidimicrobiia bacterium]|nr:alcohol dehydrogenase catalytic domain-containing protein [Acidimicrobiia bacterium]
MKAVVQDRFGGPDVLEVRDVDVPVPEPGEVLLRVRAAGVNPIDWHYLRGEPLVMRLGEGLRRPKRKILGFEASGVVATAGTGASR